MSATITARFVQGENRIVQTEQTQTANGDVPESILPIPWAFSDTYFDWRCRRGTS